MAAVFVGRLLWQMLYSTCCDKETLFVCQKVMLNGTTTVSFRPHKKVHTPNKQDSMVPKTPKILQPTQRLRSMQQLRTKTLSTPQRWLPMNQATKQNNQPEQPPKIHLIGTQTGQCRLCKETKNLLLLRYGFTLCEDCLNVCVSILEHLQNGTIEIDHQSLSIKPQKKKKTSRRAISNKTLSSIPTLKHKTSKAVKTPEV
jgi:hypothetical protein